MQVQCPLYSTVQRHVQGFAGLATVQVAAVFPVCVVAAMEPTGKTDPAAVTYGAIVSLTRILSRQAANRMLVSGLLAHEGQIATAAVHY